MNRFLLALKAFWFALTEGENGLKRLIPLEPPAPTPPEPARQPFSDLFHAGTVYTLVLLQREGRLIDFLQENISGYQDAEIGAAVRQIHADCRTVFDNHIKLACIEENAEGVIASITEAFDPNRIKITGNIPDAPPYKGIVRHRGWQVTDIHFPSRSDKIDPMIIQPAEIEID